MSYSEPDLDAPEETVEITDIPNKGKGLVAKKPISRGTRFLSEEPIVSIADRFYRPRWEDTRLMLAGLVSDVRKLSAKHKELFLSMDNMAPSKKNVAEHYFGIMLTAGCSMDHYHNDDEARIGIFQYASRINHACDKNAVLRWHPLKKRHFVMAYRDIAAGEEITTSYFTYEASRELRRKMLSDEYGFHCTCNLCSLPPTRSKKMDKKMTHLVENFAFIFDEKNRSPPCAAPRRVLRKLHEQIQLIESTAWPMLFEARALCLNQAGKILMAHGDCARALVLFQWAGDALDKLYGGDDMTLSECLMNIHDCRQGDNPLERRFYMTEWGTDPREAKPYVEEARRIDLGMPSKQLHKWLWADILNVDTPRRPRTWRECLLSYNELPVENMFAEAFHVDRGEEHDDELVPHRHWCFAGTVVLRDLKCTNANYHELLLRDADNETSLWFIDKQSQGSISPDKELFPVGSTLIVLDVYRPAAENRIDVQVPEVNKKFPFCHISDWYSLKNVPMILEGVQELGETLEEYGSLKELQYNNICHGCSREFEILKACGGCGCFSYCSTACQKHAWKVDDGHKHECKILGEGRLKDIYVFDWQKYDGPIYFSLSGALCSGTPDKADAAIARLSSVARNALIDHLEQVSGSGGGESEGEERAEKK